MLCDFRSAPISEPFRATLAFLEKLTLEPAALTAEDARQVLAAGVPPQALEDAIVVSSLFSQINRLADAMGWQKETPEGNEAIAARLLRKGYLLGP